MNQGNYFMTNMIPNPMAMRNAYGLSRGTGFFSRMLSGIRSLDWSKMINGANQTLNVVNQTIPLVKQAKPMISNVRSMVKLVRAFGNEANNKKIISNNTKATNNSYSTNNDNDNYPKFCI